MAQQHKDKITEVPKGLMSSDEVRKLENIVRNLPITKIRWLRTPGRYGEIYLAYGKRGDGGFIGYWACRGVGRDIWFSPKASESDIRANLIDDSYWMMSHMDQKGMLDDGFWQAGR